MLEGGFPGGTAMAPYSMDLRVRVMSDVDGGMRTTAVAQKYRVSADWIRKLKRLRRETGSFAPRQQRVSHATKLDEDLPRLEQLVAQQPDATLKELRDALGAPVSISSVWRALRRLQLTFKKKCSTLPSNSGLTFKSGGASGRPARSDCR